MPKINRSLEPGAVFHIMNRGVERRELFIDDWDRGRFLKLIEEIHEVFQCEVLAYCLMGNHFHLVLADPHSHLSKIMWALGSKYARIFNRRYDRDGPLFRGRFKSTRIVSDAYLRSAIEYVHLNPQKDGFVKDALHWPWSSHKYYENLEPLPKWMTHAAHLLGKHQVKARLT